MNIEVNEGRPIALRTSGTREKVVERRERWDSDHEWRQTLWEHRYYDGN